MNVPKWDHTVLKETSRTCLRKAIFGLNVWETLQNIAHNWRLFQLTSGHTELIYLFLLYSNTLFLMLYSHLSIILCYVGSHCQGKTRTTNLRPWSYLLPYSTITHTHVYICALLLLFFLSFSLFLHLFLSSLIK